MMRKEVSTFAIEVIQKVEAHAYLNQINTNPVFANVTFLSSKTLVNFLLKASPRLAPLAAKSSLGLLTLFLLSQPFLSLVLVKSKPPVLACVRVYLQQT